MNSPVHGTTRHANSGEHPSDTGVDILVATGSQVVAVGAGVMEQASMGCPYMEDSAYSDFNFMPQWSALLRLAIPVMYNGKKYRWAYYTHLKSVEQKFRGEVEVPVQGGEVIGSSGKANQVEHVHLGIWADRRGDTYLPSVVAAKLIWPTEREVQPVNKVYVPNHSTGKVIKLYKEDFNTVMIIGGEKIWPESVTLNGSRFDSGQNYLTIKY